MNLSEIRNKFVEISGRYDLVNEDGSDNGANFYINAGQKFLDRLVERHEDIGRTSRILNTGDYFAKLSNCRAIHSVGVGQIDNFKWLERCDLKPLMDKYGKPFQYIQNAKPEYFAPAYIRPANLDSEDYDGIVSYMDVMSDWKNFNGIIITPPSDQQYHLEIWGKFYSNELLEDSDKSWWTENLDYVLVMAAQRALEVFYRNTQGINDWTNAIRSEMITVEQDYVEELYYQINQLEG